MMRMIAMMAKKLAMKFTLYASMESKPCESTPDDVEALGSIMA